MWLQLMQDLPRRSGPRTPGLIGTILAVKARMVRIAFLAKLRFFEDSSSLG